MKKLGIAITTGAVMLLSAGCGQANSANRTPDNTPAKVYFIREINPQNLIRIYEALGREAKGRVAVKLSTGEPGGSNFLQPALIGDLVKKVNGTIVECNTAYGGGRASTADHLKAAADHGFTAIAPVDIMDADGDASLPVKGGRHLKELAVGSHLLNYDSMLVLTHFKGHTLGGFGGSLKNISIGCASGRTGKQQLHRLTPDGGWPGGEPFMERMVEGGKAVVDHFGTHIAYINVLRNMSVSCDCEGTAAEPVRLPDLGILASTDIQAIDRASVDMIYALPEDVRAPMVERMESRKGLRQLSYMKEMGLGSSEYELIWV